jgi:hypothetical protein
MRVSSSQPQPLRLALSSALFSAVVLAPAPGWAQAAAPAAPAPAQDAGRAPGAAEPAPAPAPAPAAAAGKLIITADSDDLVAEIKAPASEPRLVGLKKGENTIEVTSGSVQVSVQTKGGRKVVEQGVDVPAGGQAQLAVRSRGILLVQVPADADVQVGGKDVDADAGKFQVELEPGSHSLVVQRPGQFGQKGSVTVEAGKTATVAPQFEAYDYGGRKTYAYAAIIGGGALVVAAIAVDALSSYDELGGDVTRWSLLGVGAAGFVGGTILLKHTLDEAAPVKDVRYDVKVAGLRGGAVANLTLRF